MFRRLQKKRTVVLIALAVAGATVTVDSLNQKKMSGLITRIKNWILGGVWQPDPEMRKQIPFTNFPRTLEGFGYHFTEEGEMRNIKTNERFQFEERETDPYYNQKRYEAVGDAVTEYIDQVMIEKHKLKKVTVPIDLREKEPKSYFFMSEDALTAPRLMILIHGSGAVRAGQWSRRLIINENLMTGSQLPYIERAQAEGYGLIITNTNLNTVTCNRQQITIRDNENAECHGKYVWQNFVAKAAARDIAIVAHSYGGIVTVATGTDFPKDFLRRVFAIAFTDSVHSYALSRVHPAIKKLLQERAVNYASSMQPLGTPLEQYEKEDCPAISAGTSVHEMTSWCSMEFVFKFFADRYEDWQKAEDRDKVTAELEAERKEFGEVAATDASLEWEPDDSFLIEAGIIKPDSKSQKKKAVKNTDVKPVEVAAKAKTVELELEAGKMGEGEKSKETTEVPIEGGAERHSEDGAGAGAAAAAAEPRANQQDADEETPKLDSLTIEDEKSGETTPLIDLAEGEATPDASSPTGKAVEEKTKGEKEEL